MHAVGFSTADQRADVGIGQGRIADLHTAAGFGNAFGEVARNRGMGIDALHRHADLAGMIEAGFREQRDRIVEVCILGDDHGCNAAMLQSAARTRREFRAQHPADTGAADDRHQVGSALLHRAPNGLLEQAQLSVAVSPLAVPILAGPGTIATAMSLVADRTLVHVLVTLGGFATVCMISYVSFVSGERLVRYIGANAVSAVTRMMGLILAVIGVQMFIEGAHGAMASFP